MNDSARAAVPMAGVQFPCSQAQRRFWLLDRIDPGNPALNIAVRWRVEGRMTRAELEQAFGRIVARHPPLRTRVVDAEGGPAQVVEPFVPFHVRGVDLAGLDETAALAEAGRLAQLEARASFDLAAAPLLRVTQLRLREDLAIVLVTAHRIVCDEESVAILARELGVACAALSGARVPPLPPLTLGRDDPWSWHAQRPPDQSLRRDDEFWSRALHGLGDFELRPDRPRPPIQTSSGQIVSRPLDPGLIRAVRELGQRQGATLFATTLAVLFALLRRYSGESDIAIGSPVTRRDAGSLRDAVGQFTSTIVLRGDLSGDPVFTALLAQVQGTVNEALKHLSTPLDRVIEMLKPKRDLSRNALFAVTYALQEARVGGTYGRFRLVELPPCSAGVVCDLGFRLEEHPGGWRASCEYATDLFEPETARRLLRHFVQLLGAVAADPGRRISALPMLNDTECRALVVDRNSTLSEYPESLGVPRLFAKQARRTPDAVAVACGARSLSYRELDAASNRLAHELDRCGIGSGSRVGICLERSPDLVVALLAVLKAGAAYVPLDPAYPAARLAQIVRDARPAALLTTGALEDRLPRADAALIQLDAQAARIARHPDGPCAASPSAHDVAYVIYTSGSTGRPKGVQVQHRSLTNLLWAMRGVPGISAEDTLLSVTTISFDIAALEIFLPLIVGAKLVLAQDAEVADGAALARLLREHRVTMMQATPATWQILLAAGWSGDPPLKMLCGGDVLPRTLADALLARGGRLWNLYGPTETTIWSSVLRVEPGTGPVPIGPPIANTQFYVLDAQGQLVPPGVPGELCIGGAGVALGYLNLPELTHERFVPDTFRPRAGAKLYRTGDRVRWCSHGGLEFLGRADFQVKLRGFRVELGEIEAALRAHPAVADAVAVAGRDASGSDAILAYVGQRTEAGGTAALESELSLRLRQVLPGYMCPATITVLPALPRTPNGKIDRKALPPAATALEARRGGQRPMRELERRLAQHWSAVLGRPVDDVGANFFEIGGHSLLAVRLLARIESGFGHTLSLAALFRHPTIAEQARLLEHGDPRAFDFRQVVTLQPTGLRPPMIALNNTGIYYSLAKHLGLDQPFTSLQLFDPARPPAELPRTLEDIAAAYVQLIRRVQPSGPYALLGWCVGGTLAFEAARQLRAAGQEVSQLVLFDTLAPGHLGRLPWWRAVLADRAYRWQLIAADWRRTRGEPQRLGTFLRNRRIVRHLMRRVGREAAGDAALAPDRPLSLEQYDRWLLQYLEAAAASYEPRLYPGAITLFRSSQEPAGRFIDPLMGWGAFATGGVELVVVEGDHFSMFQEPAVARVARRIKATASVAVHSGLRSAFGPLPPP